MRRSLLCAALLAACLASACAVPPDKEINQAQGAIDAARAAGAERYAEAELAAATTSLTRANDAVAQRDYRMALNNALESREHAQNAARDAAANRARLRAAVERALTEITDLADRANGRVAEAQRARVSRLTIRSIRQELSQVNTALQKAGAAATAEDYVTAEAALAGVKDQLSKAIASLDASITSQSSRRRR
jgi:hypothetical protein